MYFHALDGLYIRVIATKVSVTDTPVTRQQHVIHLFLSPLPPSISPVRVGSVFFTLFLPSTISGIRKLRNL
jgi:hypothetical protein